MPRTPQRPVRARSRRPFLLLALPIFLIAVAAALFGVRAWVQSFLHSDDFRHFLDRKASALLRADGHFAALQWQDTEVYSDAFEATGSADSPVSKLTADQVRARLDLHALWNRTWRVESVQAEKFTATLAGPHAAPLDVAAASAVKPASAASTSSPHEETRAPGFLAGLLPSRVEVGEVRINDFTLAWDSGRVAGTRIVARPRDGAMKNWEIDGTGGRLQETHFPSIRLTSFNVKSSEREIFVTHAEGEAETGGRLDLSGRQALDASRALDLTANIDGVPVTDFLPPDWRARLRGKAVGTVRITGTTDETGELRARGHVDLKDGQLEALPMLDQLALFTATDRFRRIPLQKARADFEWTKQGVTVSNLLAESEGLLRIEGNFAVRGDQIDGTLQIGVARNSLQWIAVLGARVFNQPERDGYLWTAVRLSGPVQHPSEDLSPRLIAAAQQELLDKTRQGIDKAQQGAGAVRDTAKGLLDLLLPR